MNQPTPDEPSTSSSNISRRRIAFRPPASSVPLREQIVPTPAASTESDSRNSNPEGDVLNRDDQTVEDSKSSEAPRRKSIPWSYDEVCAFYEAIKTHGKDFDNVVKALARRKVEKTLEQVKTFFINSAKAYRQMLSLTEDELTNVTREARDLFLLINACEWKRKTMNMKANVEKLRELLFEGVVNVKVGRKSVTIRTPPCLALCRYFTCSKADKIPTEVFVHLEPTSNGDHAFLRNRNHNPFLRIKMNTNDRISKLLEFTNRKWSKSGEVMSLTLWPDSACEVSSLNVHTVETSPFLAVSLNKLKRHAEEAKEQMEPKKPQSNALQLAAEVNTKTKSSHEVYYPKPFILTDSVIAEGMTIRNVKTAIIAELFCVCGRKNPIQLRYQIGSDQQQNVSQSEPWRIMIDLLNRGYGDSMSACKREEERDRRREQREAEAAAPVPKKKRCVEPVPGNPVSEIVRIENEEFESQLALLRKTTRQKKLPKRKNLPLPVISTGTPRLSIAPAMSSPTPQRFVRQAFAAPVCTVLPRKPAHQGHFRSPTKSLTQSKISGLASSSGNVGFVSDTNAPTDFSSVVISPAKGAYDIELQRKRTDEFLSSLRTPVDTPVQTPKKTVMQQLFGDDLSMSPCSTRHASHIEAPGGMNDEESVVDFTDMMYQGIKDHGDTSMSNTHLDFSVTEVQQTYCDMMSSSQNSHDYILQQFQKKNKSNLKNSKT